MKIIASMTSWPKRICNVATVLKSLLNQKIKPDLIELNLSLLEFPNKESDYQRNHALRLIGSRIILVSLKN